MEHPKHYLPADIESTSMSIIESELKERGINVPDSVKPVVKRVIHTTADFDYAENLKFTDHAVEFGIRALLDHRPIITDTNMIKSGVSKPMLKKLEGEVICYMAEEKTFERANKMGTTRAVASQQIAAKEHPGAILAVGNAPTALLEIGKLIKEGLRPALVIGVPVGFVNVVESKETIFEICEEYKIPAIIAMGRKGGSNVAAAICNALIYSATDTLDAKKRGWN